MIAALVSSVLVSIASVGVSGESESELDEAIPADFAAHDPGSLLVRLRPGVTDADLEPVLQTIKGEVRHAYRLVPGLRALTIGVPVREALHALRSRADLVLYAEPDFLCFPAATPDDPRLGEMYGLESVRAAGAWDVTTGDPNLVIAVIDTGIDASHPDLVPNLWTNTGEIPGNGTDDDANGYADDVHGWNFLAASPAVHLSSDHGTHVAGTIAAAGNNGMGVCGVAWRGNLMALKFLTGSGSISLAAEALEYAVVHGASISNHSWTGTETLALNDMILAAREAGHLMVCAAGNNGAQTSGYPGSAPFDNVISVAAVDRQDRLASFSNRHQTLVDLAAPGVLVLSTRPGGEYGLDSGTSMASPHVAGAAGLVRALHPEWTPREVRAVLLGTVRRVPTLEGRVATAGILDASAAVNACRPLRVTPLQTWPAETPAGSEIALRLAVSPCDEQVLAGSVRVHHRRGGEAGFGSVVMTPVDDGMYEATVPVGACIGGIECYFSVEGSRTGVVTIPEGGAAEPLRAAVLPVAPLFADDFESDRGWTVGAPGDAAGASGVWERAAPELTAAQPAGGRGGGLCFVTGAPAGLGVASHDVDGGRTSLISPRIDLSGRPRARVGYWLWFNTSQGSAPAEDTFRVFASPDDGANWVAVDTVGPTGPDVTGGWRFRWFDLEGPATLTDRVRLRFEASDLFNPSVVEAAIDDVVVDACDASPPCRADFDGQNGLQVADIFAFLRAWFASDPRANFDGQNGVQTVDVLAFLRAWFAGC